MPIGRPTGSHGCPSTRSRRCGGRQELRRSRRSGPERSLTWAGQQGIRTARGWTERSRTTANAISERHGDHELPRTTRPTSGPGSSAVGVVGCQIASSISIRASAMSCSRRRGSFVEAALQQRADGRRRLGGQRRQSGSRSRTRASVSAMRLAREGDAGRSASRRARSRTPRCRSACRPACPRACSGLM